MRWIMGIVFGLLASCDTPGDGGTSVESDTSPDCHTDRFGGAICGDGVVHRLGYGPKPCSLGPGCQTGETYTCQTACRVFGPEDPAPDPRDRSVPLSAYCEGEDGDAGGG